eukprot:826841-Karenia_brevis.AAC.1
MENAVANDPFLKSHSTEWARRVYRSGKSLLCCPEDAQRSTSCKHSASEVCLKCNIPLCHECLAYVDQGEHPPQALANDNYISYAHAFIVEEK